VLRRTHRAHGSVLTILVLSLALPALALGASAKPAVTTGGVTNLTPASVTMHGKVDPNGAPTTYVVRYGPTTLYGGETPIGGAGAGTAPVNIVANVAGLAPATIYHYRVIAHNRIGTTEGTDRTFKTPRQPLGLTLAATPNPVVFGGGTTLTGTLSGTGNAGRQIVLQQNTFPYTGGFLTVGNPQLTGPDGAFSFALLAVPANTQYRVLIPDKPEIASPILGLNVAVRVRTNVSATRVRTGSRVRFFGRIHPGRPGALIGIQKLNSKNNWVTVAGTIAHRINAGSSSFSKRVRIRRGGSYRVFVAIVDGNFVSSAGRTVKIRRRF
jgi:hypothetical protein